MLTEMRLHTSPRLILETRHRLNCAACRGILTSTRVTMARMESTVTRLYVATGAASEHMACNYDVVYTDCLCTLRFTSPEVRFPILTPPA